MLSRLLDIDPPRLAHHLLQHQALGRRMHRGPVNRGYAADRLHGDITQQMRERVLKRFREGTVELLVATDVAARGLDIDDIDIVFNYDLPQDPEDYVHRIGRTGRAGRSGRAVSLRLRPRHLPAADRSSATSARSIRRERIPSQEQVEGRRADQSLRDAQGDPRIGRVRTRTGTTSTACSTRATPPPTSPAPSSACCARPPAAKAERIAEDNPKHHEKSRQPRRDDGDRPDRKGGQKERSEKRDRKDRADRPDRSRGERGDRGGGQVEAGMTRLFLTLGKVHGIAPGEVAGMIYRESNLPDGSLGRISIFPKHTLVDVKSERVDDVLEATRRAKLRGRPFKLAPERRPQ